MIKEKVCPPWHKLIVAYIASALPVCFISLLIGVIGFYFKQDGSLEADFLLQFTIFSGVPLGFVMASIAFWFSPKSEGRSKLGAMSSIALKTAGVALLALVLLGIVTKDFFAIPLILLFIPPLLLITFGSAALAPIYLENRQIRRVLQIVAIVLLLMGVVSASFGLA